MSNYYPYDISAAFENGFYDPIVLYDEISGNINIDPICVGHNINNGNIEFHFVSSLTNAEKTVLDRIVDNYGYICPYIKNKFISASIINPTVSETGYILAGQTTYSGSNNSGVIFSIDIVGYVDPGNTSYDIEIINADTNELIVETTFSNTTPARNTIPESALSNIPTDLATISIMIKVNKTGKSTKYCYISQILFWVGE